MSIQSSQERWPELAVVAEKIATETARRINEEWPKVKSDAPYKAQGILEMVIESLQKRV